MAIDRKWTIEPISTHNSTEIENRIDSWYKRLGLSGIGAGNLRCELLAFCVIQLYYGPVEITTMFVSRSFEIVGHLRLFRFMSLSVIPG